MVLRALRCQTSACSAAPASDLTLSWATFSEAANQVSVSRRYEGIHLEQGDLDARATGRIVARVASPRSVM